MIKAPYEKEVEKASTSLLTDTLLPYCLNIFIPIADLSSAWLQKHSHSLVRHTVYITHYSVLTSSSHSYYYGKRNKR